MKKFSYRKPSKSELAILEKKENLDIADENHKHSFFHSKLGIFTVRTTLPNTNYHIFSIENTTKDGKPSVTIFISDNTEDEAKPQNKNYIAETSFHFDDIIHNTDNQFDISITDNINITIFNDKQNYNSSLKEAYFSPSFKDYIPTEAGGGVISRNP